MRCLISNDSTLLKNRLQCVFIKSKCGKNGVLVMKLMPHLTSSVIFNTEDEQNKKSKYLHNSFGKKNWPRIAWHLVRMLVIFCSK